jgi:hypothetical protein
MTSIEKLDISLLQKNIVQSWQEYKLNDSPAMIQFTARQGLGSCQIDDKGILVFGGFTGRHTMDSFYIDVDAKQISKNDGQLPIVTFPFAVPSLSDVKKQIGFTVDW